MWVFEMCETVSHFGLDVISHLSNTHIYQITPLERCETKSNLDKIEPDTVQPGLSAPTVETETCSMNGCVMIECNDGI